MPKIKVVVLFGGKSPEHEISKLSAKNILANIDKNKFDVIPIEISKAGEFDIELTKLADIVFLCLHGRIGEEGAAQGFLEMLGLLYVGSGIRASALAMDKVASKQIWQTQNLPVPHFSYFNIYEYKKNPDSIIENIVPPVFIKPSNTGSSLGITKVKNVTEIQTAIDSALKYEDRIIIEEAIEGARDIEVSVLGNDDLIISEPGEVISAEEFYTYDAKYNLDSKTIVPANLDEKVIYDIKVMVEKAFKALDCRGFGRVDLLLDKNGKIFLNEINAIPGFTDISMFPKLMENSGIDNKELITRIIELGMENGKNSVINT